MTTTTLTLHTAAAEALVDLIPSAVPMTAKPVTAQSVSAALTGTAAVTASFVGSISAEMALVLKDTTTISEASGPGSIVTLEDALRPAFTRAASVLGAGVLGETRTENASTLFEDSDAVVFELVDKGDVAGWFAIRLREQGNATSGGAAVSPLPIGNLTRIRNVEFEMTVVIGKARMTFGDAMNLAPGAIIDLDRAAGAPADILLNGRLLAHGEIVVVDQDYAIRVTNIIDTAEGLN